MDRNRNIEKLKITHSWDVLIIGGGASGLGVALSALSRGLSVLLVDKSDFAKGTSSRSTKLLHGGVRYLAQGHIGLVFEALKERGIIMRNAPHIASRQAFVIPVYSFFDLLKYGIGLKVYDIMAGKLRIGQSQWLSSRRVLQHLPNINKTGLKGGVLYYDGQFDDARLAINIVQTCDAMGGCMLNYMKIAQLLKNDKGDVTGAVLKDQLGKQEYNVTASAVVNATGVFADKILKLDAPDARRSIMPSQGAHLVLDLSFLGGKEAFMIPKTSDGRVLFGIPWQGKLLVGTTDTIRKNPKLEPKALESEITFILDTCKHYLAKAPGRQDVRSVFAGLRPLAAPSEEGAKTKEVSRSHKVAVSSSKLISIIGGKWTTYRKMGEDTIEAVSKIHGLKLKQENSENIPMVGATQKTHDGHWGVYGSEAGKIKSLIDKDAALGSLLHQNYPYTAAEVVWAMREEMAVKVEDVLARRLRILFLDAKAAAEMAPKVAEIMQEFLKKSDNWAAKQVEAFRALASKYMIDQ